MKIETTPADDGTIFWILHHMLTGNKKALHLMQLNDFVANKIRAATFNLKQKKIIWTTDEDIDGLDNTIKDFVDSSSVSTIYRANISAFDGVLKAKQNPAAVEQKLRPYFGGLETMIKKRFPGSSLLIKYISSNDQEHHILLAIIPQNRQHVRTLYQVFNRQAVQQSVQNQKRAIQAVNGMLLGSSTTTGGGAAKPRRTRKMTTKPVVVQTPPPTAPLLPPQSDYAKQAERFRLVFPDSTDDDIMTLISAARSQGIARQKFLQYMIQKYLPRKSTNRQRGMRRSSSQNDMTKRRSLTMYDPIPHPYNPRYRQSTTKGT